MTKSAARGTFSLMRTPLASLLLLTALAARAAEISAPIAPLRATFTHILLVQGAKSFIGSDDRVFLGLAMVETNRELQASLSPNLFYARLAAALPRANLTIQQLDAMPIAERVEALRAAVPFARQAAEADAQRLLERRGEGPIADRELAALADEAQKTYKYDRYYLEPKTHTRIEALREESRAAAKRREAELEKWRESLPGEIHAGAFTERNTFEKTPLDGWRMADYGPHGQYRSLVAAYGRRLDDLQKAPDGPWKAKNFDLMAKALKDEKVREAALPENGEVGLARLAKAVREAKARNDAKTEAAMKKIESARARWTSFLTDRKVPRYRDISKIVAYYEGLAATDGVSPTGQYQIASWIRRGELGAGLPSDTEIRKAIIAKRNQEHVRAVVGAVAMAAGLVAMPLNGWIFWLGLGVAALGLAVVVASVYVRDFLDLDYSAVRMQWLMQFFDNALAKRPEA
jgi:hypothetical protein